MSSLSSDFQAQASMRVTALAIFVYDYILTLPSEYRLYKRQRGLLKPSMACILFMTTRYLGLAYIISISALFFNHRFTMSSCRTFLPIGAFFRATVSTSSALVFLWRTWAIWKRDRRILITMSLALIPLTIFSYPSAFMQVPIVMNGGCIGASGNKIFLALKWPYALVNLLYDTLAVILGTIPLVKSSQKAISSIPTILLADGLGFFFIIVGIHALNLAFLLSPDPAQQGLMVTFQAVLTAILAQRIITSLSERTSNINTSEIEMSRTRADRSRSGSRSLHVWKKSVGMISTRPHTQTWTGQGNHDETNMEMVKIQVQVEQEVHLEHSDASSPAHLKDDRKVRIA